MVSGDIVGINPFCVVDRGKFGEREEIASAASTANNRKAMSAISQDCPTVREGH